MELKKGMFVSIENEKEKEDFLCLQKTKTRKKKTKEYTVTVIIATFVPKVKHCLMPQHLFFLNTFKNG